MGEMDDRDGRGKHKTGHTRCRAVWFCCSAEVEVGTTTSLLYIFLWVYPCKDFNFPPMSRSFCTFLLLIENKEQSIFPSFLHGPGLLFNVGKGYRDAYCRLWNCFIPGKETLTLDPLGGGGAKGPLFSRK